MYLYKVFSLKKTFLKDKCKLVEAGRAWVGLGLYSSGSGFYRHEKITK
jgi:hypothetical protein